MTKEREVLISLLQIALGSENKFSLPETFDWQQVVDLAFDQGVAAIAVDGLQGSLELRGERLGSLELSAESLEVVPEPVEGRDEGLNLLESEELEDLRYELFGEALACEEEYSNQWKIFLQLIQELSEHNIRVLLLKGLGLSKYYPVPSHRPTGDFDIYCYGRCLEVDNLFINQGICLDYSCPKHSVFNYQGLTVENHYAYLDTFQTKSETRVHKFLESMDDDVFNEMGYYTPSPIKNYFFLLCHMARHFSEFESIKLRHVLDWGLFLKAEIADLDLQVVRRKLQEFGLERTNDLFVSLAEKVCGLDFSNLLFKRIPEAECLGVLEYIMSDKKRVIPKHFVPRFIYKLKTLASNNWKFRYLSITMRERVWHSIKLHLAGKVKV